MTPASLNTTAQIAVDGATVRLTKISGKLVASIDEPGSELAEVELTEHTSGRPRAKVSDPGAEAQALAAIAPMLTIMEGLDLDTVVRMCRSSGGGAQAAYATLHDAANAAGLSSFWFHIVRRANHAVDPESEPGRMVMAWAVQAVAYRGLISSHGFSIEHYEELTRGWRIVVGPAHPHGSLPAR